MKPGMTGAQLDLIDWLAMSVTPLAADGDELIVCLHRVDPAKNMHRYYALQVERTLFGDWAVVRRWGRIGSRRGQSRSDLCASEAEAFAALAHQRQTKERRGYVSAWQ